MTVVPDNPAAGRYAPSPTGDLHFGNLRTALIAWLCARSSARRFVVRIDDLDSGRCREEFVERQIEDLVAIGMDWDDYGSELRQSDRTKAYRQAVEALHDRGLVFECYCSRKDIQQAASAPHHIPGQYPGTCRNLSDQERARRRQELALAGRVPALRVRAGVKEFSVHDRCHGDYSGAVDDFILRRGGMANQVQDYAYNLAVVVDDAYQGVDQVVRGEDLLSSTPRQAYLAQLLQLPIPEYVHVPLVVNDAGARLSKRDGAVTLRQPCEHYSLAEIRRQLLASLGYEDIDDPQQLVESFSLADLSRDQFVWSF